MPLHLCVCITGSDKTITGLRVAGVKGEMLKRKGGGGGMGVWSGAFNGLSVC